MSTALDTSAARRTEPSVTAPSAPPRGRQRAGLAVSVLLWAYAFVAVGPLLLMLVGSLRDSADIFNDPLGLPASLDVENYRRLWAESSFTTYFVNSVVVTVGAVLLGTAVSVLAAYALARWTFPGNGLLATYFLSGLMLPIRLGIVPIFYLLSSMQLVDTLLGVSLVYAASGVPFCVFVLAAFYRQLPGELEEAARIDGAGEWRTFRSVMLPLVRPAVATCAIFQFVPLWNDFFFPLVLLRSTEKYTIPVGLTSFFGQYQTQWGLLFAGLVVSALPLIVLFLLATRQIVAGLTAGMSK
jgi:raffinose/stachyose/melibiose transport system permease protein